MKQRIIIDIDGTHTNEDGEEVSTPSYELVEKKAKGYDYEALRHFFVNIGYTVTKLEISEILVAHEIDEEEKLVQETFEKTERPSEVLAREKKP